VQDDDEGVTRVTPMAQGHYRMLPDARGALRLQLSPRLGTLLPRKHSAVSQLRDRTLSEARRIILEAHHQCYWRERRFRHCLRGCRVRSRYLTPRWRALSVAPPPAIQQPNATTTAGAAPRW